MDIRELKPLLKTLVEELEEVVPYATAFAATSYGRSATVDTRNRRVAFERPVAGVVLAAFTGEHFIETATNDFGEESLRAAAAELISHCNNTGVVKDSKYVIPAGEQLEKEFFVDVEKDPTELSLEDMLDEAANTKERIANLSSHFTTCGVRYGYVTRCELFINRAKCLYQELPRWDSMWFGMLNDKGSSIMAHGGDSRPGGYELMTFDEAIAGRKIANYEKLLGAPRIPNPGMHDCIFSPGVTGLTAHEAFGHGTEVDMYLKDRGRGHQFRNKRVAAKGVDMLDSPARPGLPGSFFFDHEGNLATETKIIDDGILVRGLTDVNSAVRLGYEITPNSRRQDYSHKVYARMTNTFFGPGNDTFEDMLASIEHGYLVGLPSNGMEDPKGWGIQCEASLAREIKDGKLTDNFFTPVVITGYVPELLESISMVGKDMQFFTLGACGKGKMKEFVRVSYGGPFLRLRARIA